VSSPEKAELARRAGADLTVNYRSPDAAEQIRSFASRGVDAIVELAPAANAALDHAVAVTGATIAVYANEAATDVTIQVRPMMVANLRYQFVLVYTVPELAKTQAVADVAAAVADGAIQVGEAAGLPLHRFALADTDQAHQAVETGAVGKVLIELP
jgi:NADPH2:quinone reductase